MNTGVDVSWNADYACHELRCFADVPVTRETAFRFFSDAFNLEDLTPPSLHFQILTPAPINIRRGTLIDYRLRLYGIPFNWRTEITLWEPPFAFIDRQLQGPYRLWEHHHTFHEIGDQTRVEDVVRYRVPGGRLINRLFVEREVRNIFEYRSQQLIRLLSPPKDSYTADELTVSASPAA